MEQTSEHPWQSFSPEEFLAYFSDKSTEAKQCLQALEERQEDRRHRKTFRNFKNQALEVDPLQVLSGFPEEAREIFEVLATNTDIEPERGWGSSKDEVIDHVAKEVAQFMGNKNINRQSLFKVCSALVWQEMEVHSRVTMGAGVDGFMDLKGDSNFERVSWTRRLNERIAFYLLWILRSQSKLNSEAIKNIHNELNTLQWLVQIDANQEKNYFCTALIGMLNEMFSTLKETPEAEEIFTRAIVPPETKGLTTEQVREASDEVVQSPQYSHTLRKPVEIRQRLNISPIREESPEPMCTIKLADSDRVGGIVEGELIIDEIEQNSRLKKGGKKEDPVCFSFYVKNGRVIPHLTSLHKFETVFTDSQLELLRYFVVQILAHDHSTEMYPLGDALWNRSPLRAQTLNTPYTERDQNLVKWYQQLFQATQRIFKKALSQRGNSAKAKASRFTQREVLNLNREALQAFETEITPFFEDFLLLIKSSETPFDTYKFFEAHQVALDGIAEFSTRKAKYLQEKHSISVFQCIRNYMLILRTTALRMLSGTPAAQDPNILESCFAVFAEKSAPYFAKHFEDQLDYEEFKQQCDYSGMFAVSLDNFKGDSRVQGTERGNNLIMMEDVMNSVINLQSAVARFASSRIFSESYLPSDPAEIRNPELLRVGSFGRDIPRNTTLTLKKDIIFSQDMTLLIEPDNTNRFLALGRLLPTEDYQNLDMERGQMIEDTRNKFLPFVTFVLSDPKMCEFTFYVSAEGEVFWDALRSEAASDLLSSSQRELLQYYVQYSIQGMTDSSYVEVPPPRVFSTPPREREYGLPSKKRIAFPRERRKVAFGEVKGAPKEPSDPKFKIDNRIPHSRLVTSGRILSRSAFENAQENLRVRLWAFVYDPQDPSPSKRLKPIECLDVHGVSYEDILVQAIRIKTEYESPSKRILFQTFVREVKKGDQVRESVAEVITPERPKS